MADYPTLGDARREREALNQAATMAVWSLVELPRERLRQWRRENPTELGKSAVIPPPGPPIASGFSLFPKPRAEGHDARSRAIDKLLERRLKRAFCQVPLEPAHCRRLAPPSREE